MSQPVHSPDERGAAVSRLERAGLEPATAAAVMEEIQRGESRFATADQVGKIEVGLARLQGDVRAVESGLREVEARLGGRIDVLAGEIDSLRTSSEARFEAIDGRFKAVDGRFKAVDDRFNAVDDRFNAVDSRFDAVDRKIDRLREELLGRMDVQFGAFRWENRLLLLVFSTMLGLLMALFRFGVL